MKDRRITAALVHRLKAPLTASFVTATALADSLDNFAIEIRLQDGTSGWGEIPILPPLTRETHAIAETQIADALPELIGQDVTQWRRLGQELTERLSDYPSVRAGIEMAILDAFAKCAGLPLFQLFGGSTDSLVTDITIPICTTNVACTLAGQYRSQGFTTLKVKIGKDPVADTSRVLAIHSAHPEASLILDANAGYTAAQTLQLLIDLQKHSDIQPALLEQPVPADDWEGMERLTREANVPVAADESCASPAAAHLVVVRRAAHAINIKVAKSGVTAALDIIAVARSAGLRLMIGGMVESRIAMGFSAHLAAGLGNFEWVDLDTPLLLACDPVVSGCHLKGPRYMLPSDMAGHGAMPSLD